MIKREKTICTMIIIFLSIFYIFLVKTSAKENTDNVNTVPSTDGINVPIPDGFVASPYEDELLVNGINKSYRVSGGEDVVMPTDENGNWTFIEDTSLAITYYQKIENTSVDEETATPITFAASSSDRILEIEWFGCCYHPANAIFPTLTDSDGNAKEIASFAWESLGQKVTSYSKWLTLDVKLDANKDYTMTFPEYMYSSSPIYLYIKNIKLYNIEEEVFHCRYRICMIY